MNFDFANVFIELKNVGFRQEYPSLEKFNKTVVLLNQSLKAKNGFLEIGKTLDINNQGLYLSQILLLD